MFNRKGQTILEYTMILIIIIGVVIAMRDYVKRGVQGRWKSATDDFGDQYDPAYVNSNVFYATQVTSVSTVTVVNGSNPNSVGSTGSTEGQWTNRLDTADSLETKNVTSQVGN